MRRHWIDSYLSRTVGEWPDGLLTVDVGGSRRRKRGNFDIDRFGQRVICLNISAAKSPNIRADATQMPFASGTFDAAICAETLEHIYDPRLVVTELARVLRPASRLVITVPFMFGIHADPEDYGRYTPSFWTRLLGDCGFCRVEIEEQGGFGSVLVDMARHWLMAKRSGASGPRPLLRVLELAVRAARIRVAYSEAKHATILASMSPYTTGYGISALRRGVG
jgi:SAM-dependent methyltransferase